MTIKLGYCIHCGQANITCINTQKDGTMTHYSIAKQGECGPLIIDDVEIPEPNWKARTPPQKPPCPYYCEPSHVVGEKCACPCHSSAPRDESKEGGR